MENEILSKQSLEFKLKNDTYQTENNDLKHHVETLKKVNEKFRENELYLQKKFEEMRLKGNAKDAALRQKDEVIFQLTRNIEALKSDIANLEHIEDSLKTEIEELNNKRKTLEETNQQLKSQICDQGIEIRKLDSANASLARESITLKSSLDMLSKDNDELSIENMNLRDLIDKIENQNTSNIFTVHQLRQENTMLKAENGRMKINKTNLELPPTQNYEEISKPTYEQKSSFSPSKPQSRVFSPQLNEIKNPVLRKNYEEYLNKMNYEERNESSIRSEYNHEDNNYQTRFEEQFKPSESPVLTALRALKEKSAYEQNMQKDQFSKQNEAYTYSPKNRLGSKYGTQGN